MKLYFVVLRSFYDNSSNPVAVDLFSKIMALKLKGYRREYSYGVLPVSTVDFVSDHICVCVKEGELYSPIMAYRSTSLKICKKFNINFPVLDLCENNLEHIETIKEKIKANEEEYQIQYDSSLTYDFHKVKKLRINPQDYIRAMHTYYHSEILPENHFTFASGTVRFKMNRYYDFFGYSPLSRNNAPLPPVEASFVNNDETIIYEMSKLSKEALLQVKKIKWEKIILF